MADTSQHVVEFSADEKKLLDSIQTIIKKIKEIDKAADEAGDSVGKTSSGWDKTRSAAIRFKDTITKVSSTISNVVSGLYGIGAAVTGSIIPAMDKIGQGLNEMEEGIKKSLKISALTGQYNDMAQAALKATKNTLKLSEALTMAKLARSAGITTKQFAKISEMASAITLTGKGEKTITETLQQLIESRTKGISPEEIAQLSPLLHLSLGRTLETQTKGLTKTQKGLVLFNKTLKEYKNIMKETGDVLEDPFTKILGFLRKMGDLSDSLTKSLKGLASVALGMLIPAGAGALAGFAMGGPVIGALGLIVGGLVSSALAAFGINLVRQQVGDKESVGEMLRARTQIWSQMAAGGFGVVAEGKTKVKIPIDILNLAFPEFGRGMKKALADLGKGAINRSEFEKIRKKFFDSLVKPTLETWGKTAGDMAFGLRDFSSGMLKTYKSAAPALKKQAKEILEYLKVTGLNVGKLFNIEPSKGKSEIFVLGETIANLLTGLISIMMMLTKAVLRLSNGGIKLFFFTDDKESKGESISINTRFSNWINKNMAEAIKEGRAPNSGRMNELKFLDWVRQKIFGEDKPAIKPKINQPKLPDKQQSPLGIMLFNQKDMSDIALAANQIRSAREQEFTTKMSKEETKIPNIEAPTTETKGTASITEARPETTREGRIIETKILEQNGILKSIENMLKEQNNLLRDRNRKGLLLGVD